MRLFLFIGAALLLMSSWNFWPITLIAAGLDGLYCWARSGDDR